jgi:hypothetical protein
MASTLARLESSAFLPVRTPKNPCACAPVDNKEALSMDRIENTISDFSIVVCISVAV